jgi:hypothetical protein
MMKCLALLLVMALAPYLGAGQGPCDESFKKGLRKNQSFTAPCDSMVVYSKAAFERANLQLIKLQKEVALHEKGMASLTQSIALRDSLVQVYQKEVKDFENYLQDTSGPIAQLQANLEKSIQNTDRVIKIAHRNKILGVVAGGLAGLLVGSLVGAVAL